MRLFLTAALLLLSCSRTRGTTCSSIADGAFENPQTWSCACSVQNSCDTILIIHHLTSSLPIALGQQVLIIAANASLVMDSTLTCEGTVQNYGTLFSNGLMVFESGAEVQNHGSWSTESLYYFFTPGEYDTLLNTGSFHVADTAWFSTYYPTVVNQGVISGGHWELSEVINQGTVSVEDLYCYGLFSNQGEVHCSHYLWVWISFYCELEGNAAADSIIVTGNFMLDPGTTVAHSLFSIGTPSLQMGTLEVPTFQTLYCEGDFTNYGVVTGSGDICIGGVSANYGEIKSTPDICDQTLTTTTAPFLDINTGTVGPNVNWCANAGCSTLGVQESLLSSELLVYPNPAKEEITITGGNPERLSSIRQFDLEGREYACHSERTATGLVIHRESMSAGCYFLHLTDSKGSSRTVRIVYSDQ